MTLASAAESCPKGSRTSMAFSRRCISGCISHSWVDAPKRTIPYMQLSVKLDFVLD
jgi:hypothetical protein